MLQQTERTAPVIGRVLLSLIFVASGVQKLLDWPGTVAYAEQHGLPAVQLMLVGAVIVEIGAGLSVLLGFYARVGALLLFLFLIPTTLVFHNFWRYEDMERMNQMQHFMKNVTIMGGLLIVVGFGSGGCSVDSRLSKRRRSEV